MKIFKYVIFVIYFWCLFSIKSFAVTEIILNSSISRPSYLFSSSSVRDLPQMTIYLYYIEPGELPELFSIVSYRNGSFWPNSVAVPISDLRYTKFVSIFSLSNSTTKINSFISFPENLSDSADEITKARRILLKIDLNSNTLIFPSITKESHPILHLAMNAYYVLTHYLSQPPIDKYFKMWNYPIPVNIDTAGNIEHCCYHSTKDKYNRDISVSTRIDLSYLDCVYKHEYGHHIYNTIFGIEQENYTKDYEIFESCDEQTAVNEGLSFFLMSQGPFEPFLSNDMPSNVQLNLDPTQNNIQKNFLLRSGESTIYSVASALYELSKKDSNGAENILDIYNKVKPTFFQQIWNKITDAEKTADTNYVIDKNKLKYRQYLELLGIVYNRGIISLVDGISKDNQQPAIFKWGGKTFKNKLPLINKSIVADRSRITIPTFPLNVAFQLQSANNSDLMVSNVGKGYYGLKIQGGDADGDPVSSKMETSKSFSVQLLKIKDYDFADNQLKKMVCGGTILYAGNNRKTLDEFYSKYWESDEWETINVNSNGETDAVNLSYDEVYAVRVISYDGNGIADLLYPKYSNPSQQMANLFITNTLFFFQTPANKTSVPRLTPQSKRSSNLINGLNSKRSPGSSASLDPNYTKSGNDSVTAEVTVTLPGVTELKEAKGIIDNEFKFRDFYEGKYNNLSPEVEKSGGEDQDIYIVRSLFSPSGDGTHKIIAQFGDIKEDEIEEAKQRGQYSELIYENDVVTPKVNDKAKKDGNLAYIYGQIIENESGVGILNRENVKDNNGAYIGARMDYDVQIIDKPEVTLSGEALKYYQEIPVWAKKPCYNFTPSTFYDPLTGNFQLGAFEAFAPMVAKIKYKVTDKAGNESINEISLNFMDLTADKNICSDQGSCTAWEILPVVLPKNSSYYSISPSQCYKQDIVLLNSKPVIEDISFEKIINEDTIDHLGSNILAFDYSDPDGSGEFGIDTTNCSVSCSLTGELPRDFSDRGGTYTHQFRINDELLQGLEGEFAVTVKILDKLGAEETKSQVFRLNMGAPEIESEDGIADTTSDPDGNKSGEENPYKIFQGLISDRGTNLEDLVVIVYSFAIDNTGNRKSRTEKVYYSNPIELKCEGEEKVTTGTEIMTLGPGLPSMSKKRKTGEPSFNFDTSTGRFTYNLSNIDENRIETVITVYDKNCNKTVKRIRLDLDKNTTTVIGSESSENNVIASKNPPGIVVKQYSNEKFTASGIISDSDSPQKSIAVNVSIIKDGQTKRMAAVVNPSGCNCQGFDNQVDPRSTDIYDHKTGSGLTGSGAGAFSNVTSTIGAYLFELTQGGSSSPGTRGVMTILSGWGGNTLTSLLRGKEVPGVDPSPLTLPKDFNPGDEVKFDYNGETGDFKLQAHPNSFSRTLKVTLDAYDESCNSAYQSLNFYFSGLGFQALESPFWENEMSIEYPSLYPVLNTNLPYGQVALYYINRVYDSSSGKSEFNLYEPDYTRTELYINGERVNSFILYDQLNIRAKANISSDKLYYYQVLTGLWTLESPGFSFIFNAITQIFDAFFPDSDVYSWQKNIPQEYYPRITKYQQIQYYYDNRLVLWGSYVPDHLTYIPIRPLPEGWNYARSVVYDYEGNKADTFYKFNAVYKPLIFDFRYNEFTPGSPEKSSITASIRDYSNNLDISGVRLILDGIEIPNDQLNFRWEEDKYRGSITFYLPIDIPDGEHKAILEVADLNGNKDRKEISFTTSLIKLVLDRFDYRDIEGNGDGVINESERVYLDVNIKNTGHAAAEAVGAELINRSRYIKGVPESKAGYGRIPFNTSVSNNKPYEFVVEDNIFKQVDIEKVNAEFILRVFYSVKYGDKTIEKTVEFPLTVPIEKLDPSLADFRIWVNSSIKETLDPNYTLKGGWYAEGTFLKEIKAEISSGALLIPVDIIRDDAGKTFTGNAILSTGENRFVVTAVADNGAVRTAEVSVRLDSRVGVKLDTIADTREANVTVTGTAWTQNSKLDRIEIYLNGGLAGNAALNADRFSLPVVLNGGENIIRAVARDDQGKSAYDEIKVNMHGPLTLRWQRPNWQTTETPVTACGSYQVEGDDIASIVTYVNNAPNNYEVVIDRNLKTFCTKADLQPGSNLLRAVGTTTAGVTADAYSKVFYQTGGVLSIEFDPLPPQGVSNFTLTGRFTLMNNNPYTITVYGPYMEESWYEYVPVINHTARTFSVDVTLSNPPIGCGDGMCCCEEQLYSFEGYINQDAQDEYNWIEVIQTNAVCSNGMTHFDDSLYTDGTGIIEGTFALNAPGAHIAEMRLTVEDVDYNYHDFNITDYNEATGTWRVFVDVSPSHIGLNSQLSLWIQDTYGNSFACFQHAEVYVSSKKIMLGDINKKKDKRNYIQSPVRRRSPKRVIDGR